MARIAIETYGCTLNRADSDIMENVLASDGNAVQTGYSRSYEGFDYVIVNTCTVKSPTETRIIDRIKKLSAGGVRLIITGCMASANSDMILRAAPGASIVTTSNIHRISDAVAQLAAGRSRVDYSGYSRVDKLAFGGAKGAVISRIAISEGCVSSCSFCETRFARGPLNSFPHEVILKAIEMNVRKGSREIELTSQDVGAYGLDRKTDIAELLAGAAGIEGDFRIRVGMLNPEHLHRYIDRLIEALCMRSAYKFLHLPLQSASNSVLRSMGRNYTIEEFIGYVDEIRAKVRGVSIETDMIAGYPAESEGDYCDSLSFLRNIRPAFTNVSKFCARPHAKACGMQQLGNRIVKSRSSEMSRVARQVQKEDLGKLVGSRASALVTEQNERSFVCRDDYYRIIALPRRTPGITLGSRIDAEITGSTSVCLIGRACATRSPS